ncbi:MAG: hypothetical protein PHH47_04770 [Gallionella sp.]|nr:hypothetical protein [Gallionella sp.]MDD4947151.1 hypothetical protein [Gallionella sp.]MDD5612133.1 hypothetical protein [Gallionella sp.]
MTRREKLLHDVSEIDVEIRRRCIALGVDCRDELALQRLAHEVLWSTGKLNSAASGGDVAARVKVEIYALTMMVHKINIETLGPSYVSEMDEMSSLEPAWASIARAIWRELGSKGENEGI